MFREVASTEDILPGGMKAFNLDGREIVLCNDNGKFYAFDRRCGHMSAPLEMGTANGPIITCPLHSVQFDVITGKALSGPLLQYKEEAPQPADNTTRWIGMLVARTATNDIKTYPVRVDGGKISVDL